VVQNVSVAVQQASDSSSNFWGDVGDDAAAAGKFVWDGVTGPLMDAYHCTHNVLTTLDIAIEHGRWQPNNGYGPEYEYCGWTAFDIATLGLGPELRLGVKFAPEILDGLLTGGQKLFRGVGGAVGGWLDGLAHSAINDIPGLKDLLGKAKKDLDGMMCTLFNSFAASTPVEMADGSQKPISDVKVGDQVLATDPTTGKSADKPVTDVIVGQGLKHLVDVGVTDNDTAASVTATDNHPFWVVDLGRWVDAGQLKIGERLLTDDGRAVVVGKLHRHDEVTRVYNLSVDTVHTFYVDAGSTSILVHNCGPGKDANHLALGRENYNLKGFSDKFNATNLLGQSGWKQEVLNAIDKVKRGEGKISFMLDGLQGAGQGPAAALKAARNTPERALLATQWELLQIDNAGLMDKVDFYRWNNKLQDWVQVK
jgi:hypothetical protein